MRDIPETLYALAREILTERLQQDWIGREEARNDSTELFGAWKLAWRLGAGSEVDLVSVIAREIWPITPADTDLTALYREALARLASE